MLACETGKTWLVLQILDALASMPVLFEHLGALLLQLGQTKAAQGIHLWISTLPPHLQMPVTLPGMATHRQRSGKLALQSVLGKRVL